MSTSKKTQFNADQVLLKAASKGNLAEVKRRIAAGADVNAVAKGETTPIFCAIDGGKSDVVEALIAAGADVNRIAYPSGASVKSTPLCHAISEGDQEITQTLLRAGADVAQCPWGDENAAGEAAQQATRAYYTLTASEENWFGERRTKAVLEKAKADCAWWMQFVRDAISSGVKVRDYWLWYAINHSHDELALLLVSAGVNPDAAPHGNSALVRAIEHGRDDVAIALIKAGADVNLAKELPPLLVAAQKGRVVPAAALLGAKADINVTADVLIGTILKGLSVKLDVAEASTPLIVATRLANKPMVELLLKHNADLERADSHGVTALGWAMRRNHEEILAALRKAGAREPEFLEGSLNTALWSAAQEGDAAKVEQLLKRGADPNKLVEDREGKHLPIVSAARKGHQAVVQLLLRNGANVNAGATENWSADVTALMAAARTGQVGVIKALLSAGADVHAKDRGIEDGSETALHHAARGGYADVIRSLVTAGAKVNAKAKGGPTPLLVALCEKKTAAAQVLLELGADPNAGPSDGLGPLYTAAADADLKMVTLLLKHGAQASPRSKKQDFFPLDAAAGKNAVEIIRLLLKAGAPVDTPNVMGSTSLNNAALHGHVEAVEVLLEAGADPNAADRDGFTPLMAAACSGKPTVANILLDAGANVHAQAHDGREAIKMAKQKGDKEMVSLLQKAAAQQPAPKPAKKVSRQKVKVGANEEAFQAPDFSAAAASAEFQNCLREVERLCAAKPKKLDDIKGGYSFAVARKSAEELLALHHSRLKEKGAYLFRHYRDHRGSEDKLALLPTQDWADLINTFQTNGANYDLTSGDITRWLQKLFAKQPFIITGAGSDWLEGRFTSRVANSRKLAHEMYAFCPDIVDQGVGSVKELAKTLEKNGDFFFWWD